MALRFGGAAPRRRRDLTFFAEVAPHLGDCLGVNVATTPGRHDAYHEHPAEFAAAVRPFLRDTKTAAREPRDRVGGPMLTGRYSVVGVSRQSHRLDSELRRRYSKRAQPLRGSAGSSRPQSDVA